MMTVSTGSGLGLVCCLLYCCALVACREVAQPACPYQGEPDYAPSAGCLVAIDDQMLLVEMKTGGLTPPGGKARAGESAQCAAHRETWEETGLDLMPRRLVRVFDTGFHLYRCDYYRNYDPLRALPSEVSRALWLPLERFDSVRWRFAGQGALLRTLAEQ
jgi:8-oxo-dGTP pyrophosphatase MutT (NUDIX family)